MLIRPHLTCVPECRELSAENKRPAQWLSVVERVMAK